MKISTFLLLLMFLIAHAEATAQITVEGYTYQLKEDRYVALSGISVFVLRESPIKSAYALSDSNGYFILNNIPAGKPFKVLFYGEERIPELQDLAGLNMTQNQVHVTVLTVKQYNLFTSAPVTTKLNCVFTQLPEAEDKESKYAKVRNSIYVLLQSERGT